MADVKRRLKQARKALATLAGSAVRARPTLDQRDAAIQRFEYTFEAVWKAAQAVLAEREGVSAASPKSCIRACREAGFLADNDTAAAIRMTDDRNLTVHMYLEPLARRVYRRLGRYATLLERWLSAMERDRVRRFPSRKRRA